jgi:hypothetical protein
MDLGSWKRLHNLELAAHWTLTNDRPHFKQVIIPMKAAKLADRFSRALEPLFTKTVSESAFASWGEDHETSEDRRFRLTGIFGAALRFKAATISTNSRYEFVLYPLGTPHEKNASANVPRGASDRRGFDDPAQNQSWQYASLHAYAVVVSLPRDNSADALVNPKNFVSKTVEERVKFSKYNKFVTATKCEEARATTDTTHQKHAQERVNLMTPAPTSSDLTTSAPTNLAPTRPAPTNSVSTKSTVIVSLTPRRKEVINSMSNRPRMRQVRSRAVSPRTPETSTIPSTQSPATENKHVRHSVTSPMTVKRSSRGDKHTEEKSPTCDICKGKISSIDNCNRHKKNSRFSRCFAYQTFPSANSICKNRAPDVPNVTSSSRRLFYSKSTGI